MRTRDVLGWALVICGLAGWAAVAAIGWIAFPGNPLVKGLSLLSILLPAPGLAVGLGVVWLLGLDVMRPQDIQRPPYNPTLGLAAIVALASLILGLTTALLAGVAAGQIVALKAALMLVFGVLTLITGYLALEAIRRGDGVSFESHWGGLGGGLDGWRLSLPAALALVFLFTSSLTLGVAVWDPNAAPREPKAATHEATPPHAPASASAPANSAE